MTLKGSLTSTTWERREADPAERRESASEPRNDAQGAPTGAGAEGLVICAISAREFPDTPSGLWKPAFPSPALLEVAAGLLPALGRGSGRLRDRTVLTGDTWRVSISGGVIAVGTHDYAGAEKTRLKRERAEERAIWLATAEAAQPPGLFGDDDEPELDTMTESVRGVIREWTPKSRSRMVRRLAEIDYGPLFESGHIPALVTLTLPADWVTVAPTGAVFKAKMRTFQQRYLRAWGAPLVGVWKLEFQRRGAPHIHMLVTPPHGPAAISMFEDGSLKPRQPVGAGMPFRTWLSEVWADVVDHPDPEEHRKHVLAGTGIDYAEGTRNRDPKRLGIYFSKHGSFGAKEYQNQPPDEWKNGCGRFWGYWGLVPRVVVVDVTSADGLTAGRLLRRWAHANRYYAKREVWRAEGLNRDTGEIKRWRKRKTAVPINWMKSSRGFLVVNDGPSMAANVGRYLDIVHGVGSSVPQARQLRNPSRRIPDMPAQRGSLCGYELPQS